MKSSLEPAFSARRVAIFTALIGLFFFGLIARLYVLQVLRGESYLHKSEENFIQERRITHARGLILDQAGRMLVDNRPSHDVTMTVAFLPDSNRALGQLLAPLALPRLRIAELDKLILAGVEGRERVVVAEVDDEDDCAAVAVRQQRFDVRGVELVGRTPGCLVEVDSAEFPSRAAVFLRLRQVLGSTAEELKPRIDSALQKSVGLGRFKPTLLIEDVDYA